MAVVAPKPHVISIEDNIVAKVPQQGLRCYPNRIGPVTLQHADKKSFTEFTSKEVEAFNQNIQKILEIHAKNGIKNTLLFGTEPSNGRFKLQVVPYIECDILEKLKGLFHLLFIPSDLRSDRNAIAGFYKSELNKEVRIEIGKRDSLDVLSEDDSIEDEHNYFADEEESYSGCEEVEGYIIGSTNVITPVSLKENFIDCNKEEIRDLPQKIREKGIQAIEHKDVFCRPEVLRAQSIGVFDVEKSSNFEAGKYHILQDHRPLGDDHFLIVPEKHLGHKDGFLESEMERWATLVFATRIMKVFRDKNPRNTIFFVERIGERLRSVQHMHGHVINSPPINTIWDRATALLKIVWPAKLSREDLASKSGEYKEVNF